MPQSMFVLILGSANAKNVPQTRTRVRASRRPHPEEARSAVSKDEDEPADAPSCFETHRSAPRRSEGPARVSRCDAPQHEGEECILAKRTQSSSIRPMITGRCSWVPALATLGRDDVLIGQPAAAENEDRRRASVSRLFFTGNRATPTCRAATAAIFAKRTPT